MKKLVAVLLAGAVTSVFAQGKMEGDTMKKDKMEKKDKMTKKDAAKKDGMMKKDEMMRK